MSRALLPEKMLCISPSLAASVGLEGAALVSLLQELMLHRPGSFSQGLEWHRFSREDASRLTPFWSDHDIQRISQELYHQGLLLLAPGQDFAAQGVLQFAFGEGQPPQDNAIRVTPPAAIVPAPLPRRDAALQSSWRPKQEVLDQLEQTLGIPSHFAHEQLPEFVTYWREQSAPPNASWGKKFMSWVREEWSKHQNAQGAQEQIMSNQWRPDSSAWDILLRMKQIPKDFCEDAIPEFILYWREKAPQSGAWNAKFCNHVTRQWDRFTHAMQYDTLPRPISTDWQPSGDALDVLRMANIDEQFARQLVKEFVLYWRETNQLNSSWNAKFIQHAKHMWAKRHQINSPKISDRSLHERLTDTSWASQ